MLPTETMWGTEGTHMPLTEMGPATRRRDRCDGHWSSTEPGFQLAVVCAQRGTFFYGCRVALWTD